MEAIGYSAQSHTAFDIRTLIDLGYVAERDGRHAALHVLVKAAYLNGSEQIDTVNLDISRRVCYSKRA
jgi:hypothetical protein